MHTAVPSFPNISTLQGPLHLVNHPALSRSIIGASIMPIHPGFWPWFHFSRIASLGFRMVCHFALPCQCLNTTRSSSCCMAFSRSTSVVLCTKMSVKKKSSSRPALWIPNTFSSSIILYYYGLRKLSPIDRGSYERLIIPIGKPASRVY